MPRSGSLRIPPDSSVALSRLGSLATVDADLLSASDPDVGSIAKGQHGPVIGYKPQVARRVRGSSRGSCCPGETLRTLGNSFRGSTPARHHAGFLFGEGLATAAPDVEGAPSCRGYDENLSLLARSRPNPPKSVHSIFSHAIRVETLRMENFPRHSRENFTNGKLPTPFA